MVEILGTTRNCVLEDVRSEMQQLAEREKGELKRENSRSKWGHAENTPYYL